MAQTQQGCNPLKLNLKKMLKWLVKYTLVGVNIPGQPALGKSISGINWFFLIRHFYTDYVSIFLSALAVKTSLPYSVPTILWRSLCLFITSCPGSLTSIPVRPGNPTRVRPSWDYFVIQAPGPKKLRHRYVVWTSGLHLKVVHHNDVFGGRWALGVVYHWISLQIRDTAGWQHFIILIHTQRLSS